MLKMALSIPGLSDLFGRDRRGQDKEVIKSQKRQGEIIVALDGTGDTDSIKDALILVESGGVILIRPGIYVLPAAMTIPKSDIVIRGSGFGTVLKTTSAGNILVASSKNNLVFDNIKFENTWTHSGSSNACIKLTSCTDSKVINCSFIFGECGVIMDNCVNVVVNNCNCDGNASASAMVYMTGSSYCFVYGNYLSDVNDYFVELLASSHNNFFDNELAAGSGMFYVTGSSNNVFMGNICAGTGAGEDLMMLGDSDYNVIHANVFMNDGISINAATCNKNIVTGNVATISDAGTGTVVANNTI
jgi:hypothetical protein